MRPVIKKLLTPTEVLKASFEAQKKQDLERLKSIHEDSINYNNETQIIREYYSIKEEVSKSKDSYFSFSNKVKEALLTECIYKLYNGALSSIYNSYETDMDTRVKYGYVSDFIKENGIINLLKEFKTKTPLLCEFSLLVDKYHKIIMEKVDEKDSSTLRIDEEDKDNFLKELDDEEVDKIIDIIKDRVGEALEKFIKDNSNDKEKIKDIIDNTQAKMDSSSNENIAESYNNLGLRKINDIKNSRPQTILEVMVKAISKGALTDEILKESFTQDNKLNMDLIIESAVTMYAFLETLNTTKIVKVDSNYIESVYNSLNA